MKNKVINKVSIEVFGIKLNDTTFNEMMSMIEDIISLGECGSINLNYESINEDALEETDDDLPF